MKNSKISKIMGVGLAIAMLTSLLTVATPASAGTLAYTTEGLPTVVSVAFSDYAVSTDGNTIYGVVGSAVLYKSTNGGSSWTTKTIAGGTTWDFVAIAPDNADVVAVGDIASANVSISTNGAATGEVDSWNNAGPATPIGAGLLTDLTISPAVSGVRQVTAAGSTSAPLPAIASLNLGGTVATWTNLTAQGTGVFGTAATTRVVAVRFSPNYVSDRLLVAVSNDSGTGTFLNLFRFNTTTAGLWNAGAGFTDYTGASSSTGMINGAAANVTADLTLAPTYTGVDSASRNAFVAIDSGVAASSGVYQLKDSVSKLISDAVRMRSVAFNGTNLVAGRADSNVTYRSSDALATTPTLTSTTQFQRPSGGIGVTAADTKVAWAGANVVAATTGTEAAFSRSLDNGANYQDVSNYNTSGNLTIIDFAVAPDGTKWYMVTTSAAGNVNIWAKTGTTWERLMVIIAPSPTTYTLRLAPENLKVVYLVQNGTQNIYYTDDGGDKNWQIRIANENITDLAVEAAQVVFYTNSSGNIRKSANGGFLWSDPAVASLVSGTAFSLRSLGTDKLILTTTGGVVSYSTNGGTTWTRPATITGGGSLQATAATLATGDFIYAAPSALGMTIMRYKIGSVAPDNIWKSITGSTPATTTTATEGFTGLMLKGSILYAHSQDTGGIGGRLWRSLNPAEAGETSVAFSVMNAGPTLALSPDFTNAGGRTSNLQVSTAGGFTTVWAIDADSAVSEEAGDSTSAVNDEIYTFGDTLTGAITTTSPANAAVIPMNPVSGSSNALPLSWNRPSLATVYQLDLAFDKDFKQLVGTATVTPTDPAISPVASTALTGAGALNPGTAYFWRVRAITPVLSPFSATATFTTASLDAPFALVAPAIGATDVSNMPILSWTAYTGAKWYEVTMSEDPTFAIPEWSHNVNGLVYGVVDPLKNSTTYYWRVRGVTADPFVQGTKVITPAGPYATGAFTTAAEATATPPQQIVITTTAPAPPVQVITLPPTVVERPAAIPSWMLMTIIVIGVILGVALIVLIIRTRRVA